MANLLLLTGADQGLRLPLRGDRIVLGRGPRCDLVIKESMVRSNDTGRMDSVSRKHIVISCLEGKYYLEDGDGQGAESRNGTFVNDRRVPFPGRVLLQDNDHIRISTMFGCTFQEGPETAFSVEASIDHDSSVLSLQAQPAEKLRVILEISNSLSKALELDALLPRIVESLFELFKQADRGFIILRDEASGRPAVRVFKARRPGEEADARFSLSIVQQCLDNVQAILGNDGNDLTQQFPNSESVSSLPVRSLMCAPLWSQDNKALGAIQLDSQGLKRQFTQEDLNLLLGVASQASIALCNARFHRDSLLYQRRERDLEVAHHVQRALLPQHLPDVPGYAFHAYYESAQEIGGDYYDFIPLPGGRLAVLLGDVAGKGVAAALVMAKFGVEARVCLLSEPEPAAALSKLNSVMIRAAVLDRFVTLVAVVLDPATHVVTLVNAGHPSPLLLRHATGSVEEAIPLEVGGLPIGIGDGHAYGSCQVALQPGDGLVLFSDGISDAMDARGERFGTKGAHTVLKGQTCSPGETGDRLLQAVKRHAAGCPQNDDITLVCLGRART